jgi:amidase
MGGISDFYARADAVAMAAAVRAGEVAPAELVEAAIAAIERLNPRLNAVVHRLDAMARAQAAAVDRSAPLAGVPFLLKELASAWAGAPLTNSCRFLKDQTAAEDSEIVRRMKRAGLVLVGKSNAPENGWSLATEPALYGPTLNPWNPEVTCGGSSGGAAVAVATGMVPVAEASDGAGSIRVPAACCGVVGLKPSRGRVTLAPFADYWAGGAYFLCNSRTVRDTAAYLDAVAGALPGDPYPVAPPPAPYLELIERPPGRLRVGFTVTDPSGRAVDAEVQAAVRRAARCLADAGHAVEEHDLSHEADALWRTYTDMTCVETAAMFDHMEAVVGRRVGPGDVEPVTWAIIARGRATPATAHAGRIEAVRRAGRAIAGDLDRFDLFLTPVLTRKPRPLGYYDMSMSDLDAYNARWTDAVFMYPFNISGQPAMSLPLAVFADGTPLGVQLVGRHGDEATVLAVARFFEQAMPWAGRRPPMAA